MHSVSSQFYSHSISHSVGWKSYQLLKKKAMEQELSWSGLVISLSIAFFVVAGCAVTLRMVANSLEGNQKYESQHYNDKVIEKPNIAHSILGIKTVRAASLNYQASVSKGTEFINVTQGQEINQSITFTNNGSSTWKMSEVTFETGPYLKTPSQLQTSTWKKFNEPVTINRDVKSGQSITISFPLKAPATINETIQENFQLVIAEHPIPGSLVRFFITIKPLTVASESNLSKTPASLSATPVSTGVAAPTALANNGVKLCSENISEKSVSDKQADYSNCNTNKNETGVGNGISSNILLTAPPLLRVGLFSSLTPQRLTFDQTFDIYSGGQILFPDITAGTIITVSFNPVTKQYSVVAPSLTRLAVNPIRFIPKATSGIVTLLDYRATQKLPDNRFRNIIEYRYSEAGKTVWLINELMMDDYLKGLAETSASSPLEFQKIMATAARSYALYHYLRGLSFGLANASTKHASDGFHLDSEYDQVYRGYNSELRLPGLAQAVEATKGIVVTVDSKPVITPYFSYSDGRTRDWVEVWGGTAMSWLKSVIVPQDKGKTLFGHGVGLSARGALLMVGEGQSWQNVLKYFYTGSDVRKVY